MGKKHGTQSMPCIDVVSAPFFLRRGNVLVPNKTNLGAEEGERNKFGHGATL